MEKKEYNKLTPQAYDSFFRLVKTTKGMEAEIVRLLRLQKTALQEKRYEDAENLANVIIEELENDITK